MSIACQKRVWDYSQHKGGDLLVLLVVADHANDDGTGAWPSIARLAKLTRLSERAVQYSLRHLEKSGELAIEKNGGPKGCNSYRVSLGCKDCTPAKIAPVQNLHPASPAKIAPEEGVKPTAPEPSNTKEPSNTTTEGVTEVSRCVMVFSRILRDAREDFTPSQDFLVKVSTKYAALDLEEEALKMADWLRGSKGKKRPCSTSFVLNWLNRAQKGVEANGTGRQISGKADDRHSSGGADTAGTVGTSPFAKYG